MRRRRPGQQTGMSLFPFLAVLICTMGSLIVLLVLVVQQAQVDAAAPSTSQADTVETNDAKQAVDEDEARRAAEAFIEKRKLEREEHLWRTGILENERQQKLGELGDARLKLGHLEDHIRELEERWQQMQAEAILLESQSPAEEAVKAAQRLSALKQLQTELAEQIEQRQGELASQPKSYAILPYEGLHGTQRRPIYLECTTQGVTIQPAGITLSIKDLSGPPTSGNPLDAALRTIREYWRDAGLLVDSEPYPLLLVRPKGIDSYSLARRALKSWDDEFGYELVGTEKSLAFPQIDPVLVERVKKVIAAAKQRQEVLAQAMPQAFKSQRRVGAMRASPTGGFVPVGGGDDELQAQAERMLAGRSGSNSASASKDEGKTAATGGSDSPAGAAGGAAGGASGASGANGNAAPVADQRGANWALHNATASATGWSRPVQVICGRDRLVVLQEKGGVDPSRTVMTGGKLPTKMDEFTEVVRKHVEGWGTPPPRGYWKPMLFVQVQPGAEPEFQTLQTLLQNSGFEIKRVKP